MSRSEVTITINYNKYFHDIFSFFPLPMFPSGSPETKIDDMYTQMKLEHCL